MRIFDCDVLFIIDVQNDFCIGGVLVVFDGEIVVLVINCIVVKFDNVVFIQDWYLCDYVLFVLNYEGKQFFQIVEFDYGIQVFWLMYCVQGSFGVEFYCDFDIGCVNFVVCKGFCCGIDFYLVLFENDKMMLMGLFGYFRECDLKIVFVVGLVFDFCVCFFVEDVCVVGFEVVVIEQVCCGIDFDGLVVVMWESF